MNNVVSLDMAVKLAANGFPQMDGDETWEDDLYWCTWGDDDKEISLFRGGEVDEFGHDIVAYAPCATELLPINWTLKRVTGRWRVSNGKNLELNFENPAGVTAPAAFSEKKHGIEMDKDKKDKTPEQLVAAIVERGIDDVVQNMYGDKITCTGDATLQALYEACIGPIKALEKYLKDKYPDAFE